MKQQRIKNVLPDPGGDDSKRLILLSVSSAELLPPSIKELAEAKRVDVISDYELTIGYDQLSYGNDLAFLRSRTLKKLEPGIAS